MKKYEKIWSRDYTIHYDEAVLHAIYEKSEPFGLDGFFTFNKGLSVLISSVKSKEKLFNGLDKRYLSSWKDCEDFKKKLFASCKKYLNSCQDYRQENLSQFTNQQLIRILERYYLSWIEFSRDVFWGFVLSESQADKTNDFITQQIQKLRLSAQSAVLIDFANRPSKKCSIFILEEEVARYKKLKKTLPSEKLFNKYQWLPYGDLNGIEWRLSHFRKYVRGMRITNTKRISWNDFKSKLKLTKKEVEMVQINKEIAYIRDYRDEVRRRGIYAIHFVYLEAARRFKIKYRDLLYFSTPETIDFLSGKVISQKELNRRKDPGVLIWKNHKMIFLNGVKAKSYFALLKESEVESVKGLVASSGKVDGIVRLVRFDRDVKKVKPGEILIAVTTHPDYVPKMRIAKAIITDEGGLTCHAAIVARELKIPCIVGTKIATRVFKDGDKVEVDAERGIIKKL